MGAFPEDYRIPVSELIRLWVAEGFLKRPNGSSKSLEESAEECLEDLVGRHLILVTDRKFNGEIKSCSLHDMVRETCKRLLEEELKIRCVGYMPSLLTASNSVPSSLKKCTFDNCKLSKAFMDAICSLPNLQVLKLMSCKLGLTSWVILGDEFPQLEFLLIDNMEFKRLCTEDSSVLPRLKCLRLHNCSHLKEISDVIGEIPTLELIEVSYCAVAVYDWARRVQEEQESMGNDTLRVRCIRGRRSASHPG